MPQGGIHRPTASAAAYSDVLCQASGHAGTFSTLARPRPVGIAYVGAGAEPLQGFLVVVCNSEQKYTANGSTLLIHHHKAAPAAKKCNGEVL